MTKRDYDPLAFIPSADVIRRQLAEAEELARRWRVLLHTAEQIENEDNKPAEKDIGNE
jgi:hypothetical protein